MASVISVLLSLGLCLGLAVGNEDTLRRPFFWAEPGSLVPVGAKVTFWCKSPATARQYYMKRGERSQGMLRCWTGSQAHFSISSVTVEDAGLYCCLYQSGGLWSGCSHPVELLVTGIYEKPTLLALPSHSVGTGEDVTLHCQTDSKFDRFALYKEGKDNISTSYEWKSQASFPISAVTTAHGGTYRCYSFISSIHYHWSAPSDPLELFVTVTSPRPGTQDDLFASSDHPRLQEMILIGISILILLFLLFLFLYYCQHQARLKTEGRQEDGKETLRSCRPAGTTQEMIIYTAKKNSRQNISEDLATGALQEVTYAQLLQESLSQHLVRVHPQTLQMTEAIQ